MVPERGIYFDGDDFLIHRLKDNSYPNLGTEWTITFIVKPDTTGKLLKIYVRFN